MLSLGLKSTEAFYLRANAYLEGLLLKPFSKKVLIVQRILIGALLPILSSLVMPNWVSVIAVFVSVYITFISMKSVQEIIFSYSRMDIQLYITFPLYFIFLTWALVLVNCERLGQVGASLASVFFLNLVGLWPVYRRKKRFEVKERTIRFENVYLFVGGLVVVYQATILWSIL